MKTTTRRGDFKFFKASKTAFITVVIAALIGFLIWLEAEFQVISSNLFQHVNYSILNNLSLPAVKNPGNSPFEP